MVWNPLSYQEPGVRLFKMCRPSKLQAACALRLLSERMHDKSRTELLLP